MFAGFLLAAPATATPGDWAGVQLLLTCGQALSKQQQRQMPALFRAMGKLKGAAANQQTRTRLFPHLATPATTSASSEALPLAQEKATAAAPLPETPQEDPATRIAPEKPRLMRIAGQPISPLFQAQKTQDEPAGSQAKEKPKRSALLSPLFQAGASAAAACSSATPPDETTAQEPATPKPAQGLISKLFDNSKK